MIILSNHSVERFIPLLAISSNLNEFIRVLIIDQLALLQVSIIIVSNHSVERFIPLLFSSNLLFPLHLSEFI